MLTISNISCIRGGSPLFAPVSFSISPGQALHIEGDNGIGKTSLLRVVCGLTEADSGEVLWNASPLNRQHPDAVENFRSSLCYIGHTLSLKDELTAPENLLIDAQLFGRSLPLTEVLGALRAMGLSQWTHLPLRVLSQGQKRRTTLARLPLSSAKLWVLDEPFVALDEHSFNNLRALLAQHLQQGGMLLFTSHQQVELVLPNGLAMDVRSIRLVAT
jgi:heme exporter protein A